MDILIDGYGVECWEYTGDVHQIFIHDYINILVRRKERGLKIDKAVKKGWPENKRREDRNYDTSQSHKT